MTDQTRAAQGMSRRQYMSRRMMVQGALGTSVLAGVLFKQAMAAQPALGPTTINRQWLLVKHTDESISTANFAYREVPLGDTALQPGDVIVRNIVFTPLPSQRIRMHANTGLGDAYFLPMKLGEPVQGGGVARVVKSENPKFPVGALLPFGGGAWEDYTRLSAARLNQPPLPAGTDPLDAASTYSINPQTAYFGLIRIGEIKAGETVVVSGASGSVGTSAIQIARNKGCKVIGIAGGKDHCDKLVKDYGIQAAIDYKSENVFDRVKALAPKGVDVYFDNVGGTIMQDVVEQMAKFGRVILCGAISAYDSKNPAPGPRNMLRNVIYSVKLQGFLVSDYAADRDAAIAELRKMKDAGQLVYKADVRTGFKKLPESFLTLFTGDKDGTLLVRTDENA